MKKYSFQLNNVIIILISLLLFSYVLFQNSVFQGIFNYSLHLLFGFLIILTLSNLKNKYKKNMKSILLTLLEVILILVSLSINDGGFGSAESVISLLLIFLIADKISISLKTVNIIGIFSIITWIIIYIKKLDFLNTNVASYQTFVIYIIMITFLMSKLKKRNNRILLLIIFTTLMVFNAKYYDCRTILASSIFIIPFYIIPFSFWKKPIVRKVILLSIIVGSLIVVLIYLYLYKYNITFDFGNFSNKNFYSGRELIWYNILYIFFDSHYIFGLGSNLHQYGLNINGIHNYMLSLLTLFGLLNYFLFAVILNNYFKKIFSPLNFSKDNYIYTISIILIFYIDFFETHLISAFVMCALLLLTIMQCTTNINNEKLIKGDVKNAN